MTENLQPALDASSMLPLITQFYGLESMLLDEQRFDEWVGLIDDEIRYAVPVRAVHKRGDDEYLSGGQRMEDNKARILARLARLKTGHAWVEEPPSRTVRLVGSVYVEPPQAPDTVTATCAVFVYRLRGQEPEGTVIALRRRDRFKRTPTGLKLAERTVFMADAVLPIENLAIFL
jgi:3-phenylpropionate/cinnamic acid dioxygenase small subunit